MPNFGNQYPTGAFNNLGGDLSNMAVTLATLRAQQQYQREHLDIQRQQMMQQGEVYRAHAKAALYAAETALNQSKVKDTGNQSQILGDLVDWIGRNQTLPAAERAPYESKAMALAAQLAAQGGTGMAHLPVSTAQAIAGTNPELRNIIAAGGIGHLLHNVPSGNTVIDATGRPTVSGGYTLGPGQQRYGPEMLPPDLSTPGFAGQASPIAVAPPRLGADTEDSKNLGRAIQLYGIADKAGDPTMSSIATNLITQHAPYALPKLARKSFKAKRPEDAASVKNANDAILKGADPEIVKDRLTKAGVQFE